MTVYLLQHAYESDGEERVKVIGIYSSEISARRAIERIKLQPGFRVYPDGFHVGPYEIDADHWVEGFYAGEDDEE